MSSLNQCNFIGNLAADPDTRYTTTGEAVCNFTIAVNWKSKDKEGAEWVRVTAFKGLADICGKYLRKGSSVFVSGRMQTRKWTDKQGADRYTTEILADTMQMLDRRGAADSGDGRAPEGESNRVRSDSEAPRGKSAASSGFDDFPNDVPF